MVRVQPGLCKFHLRRGDAPEEGTMRGLSGAGQWVLCAPGFLGGWVCCRSSASEFFPGFLGLEAGLCPARDLFCLRPDSSLRHGNLSPKVQGGAARRADPPSGAHLPCQLHQTDRWGHLQSVHRSVSRAQRGGKRPGAHKKGRMTMSALAGLRDQGIEESNRASMRQSTVSFPGGGGGSVRIHCRLLRNAGSTPFFLHGLYGVERPWRMKIGGEQ